MILWNWHESPSHQRIDPFLLVARLQIAYSECHFPGLGHTTPPYQPETHRIYRAMNKSRLFPVCCPERRTQNLIFYSIFYCFPSTSRSTVGKSRLFSFSIHCPWHYCLCRNNKAGLSSWLLGWNVLKELREISYNPSFSGCVFHHWEPSFLRVSSFLRSPPQV